MRPAAALCCLGLALLAASAAAQAPHCPGASPEGRSARRRRYLVFPRGSAFAIVLAFAPYFDADVPGVCVGTVELTVGYPVPTTLLRWPFRRHGSSHAQKVPYDHRTENHKYTEHQVHHELPTHGNYFHEYSTKHHIHSRGRHKRDIEERTKLQQEVESLLNLRGVDGRACVRRARCEATLPAADGRGHLSLLEALMRLLFMYPTEKDSILEDAKFLRQCDVKGFCPFSLLQPEMSENW